MFVGNLKFKQSHVQNHEEDNLVLIQVKECFGESPFSHCYSVCYGQTITKTVKQSCLKHMLTDLSNSMFGQSHNQKHDIAKIDFSLGTWSLYGKQC
jgi:hypothetical protein